MHTKMFEGIYLIEHTKIINTIDSIQQDIIKFCKYNPHVTISQTGYSAHIFNCDFHIRIYININIFLINKTNNS